MNNDNESLNSDFDYADSMPKNVFSHLRSRLLLKAGLQVTHPTAKYKLQDLEQSEWNPLFERLMRNRLLMGALRYGLLNAPEKPKYDRIASMEKRLRKYRENGNLELLVDVANLALCEFTECDHPLKHFHTQDGESRDGVQVRQ